MQMLNIDVKQAATVLATFVNDHRQNKSNGLAVTYTITGSLKNGQLSVMLVKEENINNTKALFKNVSSESVYSMQKHKQIDAGIISLVDNIKAYNPEHCNM